MATGVDGAGPKDWPGGWSPAGPASSRGERLEEEAEGKLHLSWIFCLSNLTEGQAGIGSCVGRGFLGGELHPSLKRVEEAGMIEEVEGLHPELTANVLSETELAGKRQVEIGVRGSNDDVTSGVTKLTRGGKLERRDIEPLRDRVSLVSADRVDSCVGVTDQIGTVRTSEEPAVVGGGVGDGEGPASLPAKNAGELEPAKEGGFHFAVEEWLVLAEREFGDWAEDQAMADVEVRKATIRMQVVDVLGDP